MLNETRVYSSQEDAEGRDTGKWFVSRFNLQGLAGRRLGSFMRRFNM